MSKLPYFKIPDSPNIYSAGNVVSKILDGLGYRYYWATEGIREEDLNYKFSDGARSTREILIHICDLTEGIFKVATQQVIVPPFDFNDLSFPQIREKTLYNIENSSNLFKKKTGNDLKGIHLVLESNENQTEFPLWNVLVGPITDTGYHIGQIVAFRRSSGNPINPNVNAFLGYTKE
ncbi:DinB family protein [Xanthovirga aplysinae]|uniref:DinB family protein n=1 Tax=Xanthovirga aplysinae TaxID=2529853 RepID=UPI0012BD198B|nr:hypothetical protein [Xanthovirga aplysinae]MTI33103.1 hypothetical protein [Xanthovirga aplysinae]